MTNPFREGHTLCPQKLGLVILEDTIIGQLFIIKGILNGEMYANILERSIEWFVNQRDVHAIYL